MAVAPVVNFKPKAAKRAPGAPVARPKAQLRVVRSTRRPDLGDRRLELLLAAVR